MGYMAMKTSPPLSHHEAKTLGRGKSLCRTQKPQGQLRPGKAEAEGLFSEGGSPADTATGRGEVNCVQYLLLGLQLEPCGFGAPHCNFLLWLAILLYPNVSLDSASLVTFLQPLVRRHARCPRLSLWTCRSTGSRQPPQGEHTEVHTPG